jgi:preprotein translocase subunit SecA
MLKTLLGDPNARKLKKYQPSITEINLLEEERVKRSSLDSASKKVKVWMIFCQKLLQLCEKLDGEFWGCGILMSKC